MKKSTIIRTILLFLALINQVLTVLGVQPLSFLDEGLSELAATAFTVITGLWAWWKNNSFTFEAIMADDYLEELKNCGDK